MQRAALSVKVFAVYLAVVGASLTFAPNLFTALFRIAPTQEAWIRVLGVIVGVLAYYYFLAVRTGLRVFVLHTAYVRAAILPIFAALVLLADAPGQLVLFGIVDLAGAAWTYFALKKDLAAEPAR